MQSISIPFAKYSGCGNDFIIIDNRHLNLSLKKESIQRLCHRQLGIGADGLILLEISSLPGVFYYMKFFNADGNEAEMCGNGLRCLANFIRSLNKHSDNPAHASFHIQTMHQLMKISFQQHLVNVFMPSPAPIIEKTIIVGKQKIYLHSLNTGVPHVVHFVDDIENEQLFQIAPAIRFHQEFAPHGTNVNFAKVLPDQSVVVRTYERGVEKETLACGTGATATAIAAAYALNIESPVTMHLRSGDLLKISFQKNETQLTDLMMSGPALKIFDGVFVLD